MTHVAGLFRRRFFWRAGECGRADNWFNGLAILAATSAELKLNNVQASAAGNYTVATTNSAGTVKSSIATFTLTQPGNSATHAVVGSGYVAGRTVTLTNTLTYSGTASVLSWAVLLPTGWSFAASAGSAGDQGPLVGQTSEVYWVWTNIPQSPVSFTYTLNVPAGQAGLPELVALVRVSNGYIATNFLGHGTVNPKANESDD